MVYEHALNIVPAVIQESLEKAGITVDDIDKLLIHQANTKMVEAILKRMFDQYGLDYAPEKHYADDHSHGLETVLSPLANAL